MNAINFNCLQRDAHQPSIDRLRFNYSQYSYRLQQQYLFEDLTVNKSIPIAIELKGNDLAIATENGFVSLLNAYRLQPKTKFRAHSNVIFDLKWRPHHNHLLTASGDQSLVIWDVNDLCKVHAIGHGHNSSIKSVSFYDSNIFASGGRDGYIRVWDLRCETKHEVYSIADAHKNQLFKKRERRKAVVQRSNPVSVVTALRFTSDNRLFSAGANDGCIKQWDLRMLSNDAEFNTLRCARRLEYCGLSDKAEGFTCLTLDSRQQVYASCSDNRVYAYDYRGNEGKCESEYVKCFDGLAVNNYTKISVLKDDLLISGSKNSAACVWSIRDAKSGLLNPPIYKLQHGIEEVSSVTCDSMTYDIYSCDDDITISKWSLEPSRYLEGTKQTVIANYEPITSESSGTIRLASHKVITSPKTPPLTSLNSWLLNSSKQNICRSAPNLQGHGAESSDSLKCTSKEIVTVSLIESPKSKAQTPSKRRASSDACLTSTKKARSSNDENSKRAATSVKKSSVRGRKNLFSSNRSILDYFHS